MLPARASPAARAIRETPAFRGIDAACMGVDHCQGEVGRPSHVSSALPAVEPTPAALPLEGGGPLSSKRIRVIDDEVQVGLRRADLVL